ncbi:MAG: FG-GAP-like repeat-containing protein [Terriglobales bacterium]
MKRACPPYLILALVFAIPLTALAGAQPVPAGQKQQVRFAKPVTFGTGGLGGGSVAVADLNGDGRMDLVVADGLNDTYCCGEVAVLLGNGDGTFQPAVVYGTGAYDASSVAVGDVNGDGIPDLIAGNFCLAENPQGGECEGYGIVSVLLGNGDGTFQPAVTYSTGAYTTLSVALGDLRGDGILDLIASNYADANYDAGSASVLPGNGDGTFQPAVNYPTGGQIANSIVIADVNGNGIPDLVVANQLQSNGGQEGYVGVLLGNGDGTFQPAVAYDSGGPNSESVAVGDLRGNGILDVVVADGYDNDNVVGVLLGNGDGTFQPPVTYLLKGLGNRGVAIGDVNGDGIPDLVVITICEKIKGAGCYGEGIVSVLLGNGDGTFQAPIAYSSDGYGGLAITLADVNGNGRPDIIAVNACGNGCGGDGTLAVLLNETSYASKTELTSSPNPSQVNQTVTFTATVTPTPPNGELVTFYNGKSELGTGATTKGVATLTTAFSEAKTYTIKSTYPGDAFRKASSGTVKQVVNP